MFGFFVGTACLVGLFAVLRQRRHGFGYDRNCGHHRFRPLSRVLERLDATPAQEKEIRNALDQLREEARTAQRDFRGSGQDLARVIREPELTAGAFDAIFEKDDQVLARLRDAAVRALHQVHATLDARQRDLLASFVESRSADFFGFRRGY